MSAQDEDDVDDDYSPLELNISAEVLCHYSHPISSPKVKKNTFKNLSNNVISLFANLLVHVGLILKHSF